jgi:hypothetical protein
MGKDITNATEVSEPEKKTLAEVARLVIIPDEQNMSSYIYSHNVALTSLRDRLVSQYGRTRVSKIPRVPGTHIAEPVGKWQEDGQGPR